MTSGIFALPCPRCGAEMTMGLGGSATCRGCDLAFRNRFGYLMSDAAPSGEPVDLRDAARHLASSVED